MNNQEIEKRASRYKGKHLTPVRSIKLYCRELCCASDLKSWANCTFKDCFLYQYRLGKRDSELHKKNRESLRLSKKNKQLETKEVLK